MKTFDFGDGPVPAHQHVNGGGWVADSATVSDSVYIGPNALVSGDARVYGKAQDTSRPCSDCKRLTARNEVLEGAVDTCKQALLEVSHAQQCGANWYTRGEDGLYRQVDMWVRRGRDAIAAAQEDKT